MAITHRDKLTPSLKRLYIELLAKHQIDRVGPSVVDIALDIAEGGLGIGAEKALVDLNRALSLCREASEPNPFKNASDEEIAGEILKGIEKRRMGLAFR